MKRANRVLVSLLITISFTQAAAAQCIVSLTEMEKLSSYDASGFETYAMEHGFSLWQNTSNNGLMSQIYMCDKKRPNGRADQLGRTSGNNIAPIIAFTTTDKQYYLNFKKKLTAGGYVFDREEQTSLGEDTQTIFYHYSNSKYAVTIFSFDVLGVATYGHQVYKK